MPYKITTAGEAVQSRRASGPSTRSVPVLASGRGHPAAKWRHSTGKTGLLDLVVGCGKVVERQRDCDGFLREVLKTDLELLARSQRIQRLRRDRYARIAAPVFAGLDRKVGALAVIDLKFCAHLQIEPKRQLHERDRRAGVAGHADVDQHDQLPGLGEDRILLHRAFERSVAAWTAATCGPAGLRRSGRRRGGGGRRCRLGLRLTLTLALAFGLGGMLGKRG